ncbi:MAG TPA: asparagine synthase-related protein [Streptosporangiaceae bacterium]|nr:asparagine synthase-related protein [Streptosporangiaceae bacterium]
MCGIAGVLGLRPGPAETLVRRLNQAQRHRGPDHHVVARVGAVTLGNTRLAVQDPTPAGNQPFTSTDGRFTCVFNGEVYNHRQLVDRYSLAVRTRCDGEVIPHLWAKLGPAAVAELRGMFAIALWDSLTDRLYLARDAFGTKPLYWRELPSGALVFASEVRPLAGAGPSPRVSPAALARFLHLGAMGSGQSPFFEVNALPPNTLATFTTDGPLDLGPVLPSAPPGAPMPLGEALTDSVRLHLGADVPTATLLSSGADSAAICAVSRWMGRDLECLTVAAEGAGDERIGAERTARRYGHRLQMVPVALGEADAAGFFTAMQRPSIDGLNTYLISRAVRDAGFKVALSGLGGDEVVGGYSHLQHLRLLPALRPDHLQREVMPAGLAAALTGAAPPATMAGPGWASWGARAAAEVALYLQPILLADADTFSMACSVELRVPFVDTGVIGAALGVAAQAAKPPGKSAVGRALGDTYLRWLAEQRKRRFRMPMPKYLAGPLAPVLAAASEPTAPVWSVLDRSVAEQAGLTPLRPQARWAPSWSVAVLNTWLTTLPSPTGHDT